MEPLKHPVEDYYIGKGDTDTWYYITKEAYLNWYNHKVGVKRTTWGTQKEYSLGPTSPFKACCFDRLTDEDRKSLRKSNLALFSVFSDYWKGQKPVGRFDHIKPDEVCITRGELSYQYYITSKDEWNSLKQLPESIRWESLTSWKPERSNVALIGVFKDLPQSTKVQLKSINPELYKHFEDFYNKPKALKFSDNPDDYWFFTRGRGWEFVRRDHWRGAEVTTEVDAYSWRTPEGRISFITPKQGFVLKSFKSIIEGKAVEAVSNLRVQNPEQCAKYEAFYRPKQESFGPLAKNEPMSNWLVYQHGPTYNVILRHKDFTECYWSIPAIGEIALRDKVSDHHKSFLSWTDTPDRTKRELQRCSPELYRRFEAFYNAKPECGCNQPTCIYCSQKIARLLGWDFDVDKQICQNVATRPATMHELLGLYQEKPTLDDWGTILNPYNQQINSPLTNNNEKSIVQIKNLSLSRRKELSRTGIPSSGVTPSVTRGHITDGSRPISSEKRTGSSKICLSIRLGTSGKRDRRS